jgi:hypothetical protein
VYRSLSSEDSKDESGVAPRKDADGRRGAGCLVIYVRLLYNAEAHQYEYSAQELCF